MYKDGKIYIGVDNDERVILEPSMANRHGLIAGATGTGKTTTLRALAESFSDAGVPVFLSDAKGDLSGICKKGEESPSINERVKGLGLEEEFAQKEYPTTFWDVFGENGIPLRTTISEMGPVLLSKLLGLNDTQSAILTCLFKMADDEGLLLVDIKDLKAMLQYASDNSVELSKSYGSISKQSVATIIRGVVALEAEGGDSYFGEPAINILDLLKTDINSRGIINLLDATRLSSKPTLYSAFLLYLLSELYETLPEVGDLDKPRIVLFFDEAHLIFNDMSKQLAQKVEQIVKLIRSKGVGVYFITQSPKDIPDGILAQLGNKIQHALRAYTPAEEKGIKAVADSFRVNPAFDTKTVLSELGIGEALVSTLDEAGVPNIVRRCMIIPPQSKDGQISDEERSKIYKANNLYLTYCQTIETDSAYEYLERMKSQQEQMLAVEKENANSLKQKEKEDKARERENKKVVKSVARTAAGTVGRELGKSIGGSVGGSFGKKLGGNVMAQLSRSIMGTFLK